MTRQVVLHSPASPVGRRRPLLELQDYRGGVRKVGLGELAGGTAAECAAVCCCCPCGLVNLLVLAMYKLPAGLCRKALRRNRRRRLIKQGLLPRKCGCEDDGAQVHTISLSGPLAMVNSLETSSDEDVLELETEMWDKFYSAGFWRSSSQRSEM